MLARVLRLTIKPERFGEARDAILGDVVPALRAQPGFVRGAMLFDRAGGDAVTIVLWESKAAVSGWENSGTMAQLLGQIVPTMTAPPAREIFNVAYRIPIEGDPTYARSIEGTVKAGHEAAIAETYAKIVDQGLKNQPGFQAALLLVDPQSRRGFSVTAWDSEAALKASEGALSLQANLARAAEHFEAAPTVRTWELRSMR